MLKTTNGLHKVVALVAAVGVTFVVQAALLTGFDAMAMASAAPTPVVATCTAITLPSVTVTPRRG